MNKINVTDYLANGGCLNTYNYNFIDWDEDHDLEKIGSMIDDKLNDCINIKLFDPNNTHCFYSISQGINNIDNYSISILSLEDSCNLFAIILYGETVSYYDYWLDEELEFDSWELFLNYFHELVDFKS